MMLKTFLARLLWQVLLVVAQLLPRIFTSAWQLLCSPTTGCTSTPRRWEVRLSLRWQSNASLRWPTDYAKERRIPKSASEEVRSGGIPSSRCPVPSRNEEIKAVQSTEAQETVTNSGSEQGSIAELIPPPHFPSHIHTTNRTSGYLGMAIGLERGKAEFFKTSTFYPAST